MIRHMPASIVFVLLFAIIGCKTTPERSTGNEQEFKFENYQKAYPKPVLVTSEEAEFLVGYVSIKDSSLIVVNEDRLKTLYSQNVLKGLTWDGGQNASFLFAGGLKIPLTVRALPLSVIILMVPNWGDVRILDMKREYENVAGGITQCFNMKLTVPYGDTLITHFRNMVYNYQQPWEYSYEKIQSGKVAQADYERWTVASDNGDIGLDIFDAIQKYYAYTSEDCSTGFTESNRIKMTWIRSIGMWPNP